MRFVLMLAVLVGLTGKIHAADLLHLVARIPMPDVAGRIDHLAQDSAGKRLFVAALGNDTVEVLDLAQGKRVKTISGLKEPQGIAYLPDGSRLVIAEGDGSAIDAIDGATFDRTHRLAADDADNVRVDAASGLVYVGSGSGRSSALVVVEPKAMTEQRRIALPGHPEAFVLEQHGPRIYINVPTDRSIVVVDRARGETVARWAVTEALSNFPMALDEAHQRLLVACRSPAKLLIYDTQNGALVGALDCAKDADDIFIDAAAKRFYVIGGEGIVTVIDATDPAHLAALGSVETSSGARTGWFDEESGRLYVACPKRANDDAHIRVYARQTP
jgi:YVTN family beta-propeller protein